MDSLIIGTATELNCESVFTMMGCIVSVPVMPVRYDFIIDTGKHLYKVQVKSCHKKGENVITFSTASMHKVGETYCRFNYQNDNIDFFCTWYNGECYLVPVSECGLCEKNLRLTETTKNGQSKKVCYAKDYTASEVLKRYDN